MLSQKLHTLMYGLLYPAFLGAFIVALSTSPASQNGWVIAAAVLLAAYFALAFTEVAVAEARTYSLWPRFAFDAAEIVIMSVLFWLSGVATLPVLPTAWAKPSWLFFFLMGVVFAMPSLGRWIRGEFDRGLIVLSGIGLAACVVAAGVGRRQPLFQADIHKWILVLLYVALVVYARKALVGSKGGDQRSERDGDASA